MKTMKKLKKVFAVLMIMMLGFNTSNFGQFSVEINPGKRCYDYHNYDEDDD